MIVVDTSVWIEANRRPSRSVAAAMTSLLDADEVALALPVRLELLAGVARRDRTAFARGLSALPVLHPSDTTWELIARWVPAAADRGYRFGLTDLIVAALTHEIGGLVWSLDEDFAHLEALKMVSRFSP